MRRKCTVCFYIVFLCLSDNILSYSTSILVLSLYVWLIFCSMISLCASPISAMTAFMIKISTMMPYTKSTASASSF